MTEKKPTAPQPTVETHTIFFVFQRATKRYFLEGDVKMRTGGLTRGHIEIATHRPTTPPYRPPKPGRWRGKAHPPHSSSLGTYLPVSGSHFFPAGGRPFGFRYGGPSAALSGARPRRPPPSESGSLLLPALRRVGRAGGVWTGSIGDPTSLPGWTRANCTMRERRGKRLTWSKALKHASEQRLMAAAERRRLLRSSSRLPPSTTPYPPPSGLQLPPAGASGCRPVLGCRHVEESR